MSINPALFSSNSELWETPQNLFDELNKEFNFTLDVCALPNSAKCERYFTPEQDGLSQNWGVKFAGVIHRMVERLRSGLKRPQSQKQPL